MDQPEVLVSTPEHRNGLDVRTGDAVVPEGCRWLPADVKLSEQRVKLARQSGIILTKSFQPNKAYFGLHGLIYEVLQFERRNARYH